LTRENGILDLRDNRLLIADDPWKQFLTSTNFLDEVLPHLFFDRKHPVSTITQLTNSAWSSSYGHSVLCYLSWGLASCDACLGMGTNEPILHDPHCNHKQVEPA